MQAWLGNNLFTFILMVGFLLLLGFWWWLRYRMTVSKARFALATIATLGACAAALLTFLSGPAGLQVANAVFKAAKEATGLAWIPELADTPGAFAMALGFVSTVLAMFLIYRFSTQAIRTWDGPVTVSVNELAKLEQDNNLVLLARAELVRLISRQPDPIAGDAAVNWRQEQRDAPGSPPWHQLARNVFQSAYAEAVFSESSWRDRIEAWVGEMYTLATDTKPLLLFVFDEEPEASQLKSRIDIFTSDGGSPDDSKIFAIFNTGALDGRKVMKIGSVDVEVWPFRKLLKDGLKLATYARDLIRRFESETLGGTSATLKDTFVEAHVREPKGKQRKLLSDILSSWLTDGTRRHLAITGEYGQGKSTAMLAFGVQWARAYLANAVGSERIPLLVELRGQNPAESDPVAFLSAWAGRYGVAPRQVYNLIQAGEAIIIFEGFDELRNAGRAYDRHEHFNALWGMAFPGTKLIFTGRPNFFLDEKEKNGTLRTDKDAGAAGNAFTQLWELDRLTEDEVEKVACGYGEDLGRAITRAAKADPAFLDIVSRPSMLPVVATIWPSIEQLQQKGYSITSAVLLERYIKAVYDRKEAEIEKARQQAGASHDASYILLPREVRETFTAAVVWKMAGSDARNTITRRAFDAVINRSYDNVFKIFQADGVPQHLQRAVRQFQERFKDEPIAERCERVASEVASTGLFVPDPAGGPDNLRFPHKQFYEYMIAKISWLILMYPRSPMTALIQSIDDDKSISKKLLKEDRSLSFLSDLMSIDYSPFKRAYIISYLIWYKFIVTHTIHVINFFNTILKSISKYDKYIFISFIMMVGVGLLSKFLMPTYPIIEDFPIILILIITQTIFAIFSIRVSLEMKIFISDKVNILRSLVAVRLQGDRSAKRWTKKWTIMEDEVVTECLRLIRASDKSAIRREFIQKNFLIARVALPSIQLTFDPIDDAEPVSQGKR